MNKTVLGAIASFFLFFSGISCIKDTGCREKTIESERGTIQAYATANGIIGTEHSSGIYYQVTNPGSGPTPTLNSKIFVTYTGKLLDGTVFDSGTTPTTGTNCCWALAGLIQGWQIGLTLIQKGGHIKLIIPSSMAYGCKGFGSVPGNAILYFDIDLNDVQ
jgi:FKBP-type peptidyl-prolyl cis-trans isomerase FkpA